MVRVHDGRKTKGVLCREQRGLTARKDGQFIQQLTTEEFIVNVKECPCCGTLIEIKDRFKEALIGDPFFKKPCNRCIYNMRSVDELYPCKFCSNNPLNS